jgi:hypothetical protein
MPGLDAYREEREAATQGLDVGRGGFHDGREVLSTVDHWHADVAAGVDAARDLVTLPLLNMIEDMLGPLPRPSASTLWYKSRRILQGALRSPRIVGETSSVSHIISRENVEQTTKRWMMLKGADTRRARRLSNSSSNPSAPLTVFSDTKEDSSSIESSSVYHSRSQISSSLIPTAPREGGPDVPAIKLGASGAVGFEEQSLVPRMLSTRPVESQGLVRHSRAAGDRIDPEAEDFSIRATQSLGDYMDKMSTTRSQMVGRQPPQSTAPQLPVPIALKWLKGKRDIYLPRHELLNTLKERDHVCLPLSTFADTILNKNRFSSSTIRRQCKVIGRT